MPLLTRVGAAATKANLVADIRTAFVAAGFSESGILNGNSDQRSYGYPAGAEIVYIPIDFNTASAVDILCMPAYGIDTAVDYDLQPRGPLGARGVPNQQTKLRPTPLTMANTWVFYDEPVANVVAYVHVVAEVEAGVFAHLCMGVAEKAGTYSGGAYTTGGSVRAGVDTSNTGLYAFVRPFSAGQAQSRSWITLDTTLVAGTVSGQEASGGTGGGAIEFVKDEFPEMEQVTSTTFLFPNLASDLMSLGIDARTGLTPMIPTYMVVDDTTNSTRFLLGTAPNVRYSSVEGLSAGLNIVTVGAESWYVFPMLTSGEGPFFDFDGGTAQNSGIHGIAHLLVP